MRPLSFTQTTQCEHRGLYCPQGTTLIQSGAFPIAFQGKPKAHVALFQAIILQRRKIIC